MLKQLIIYFGFTVMCFALPVENNSKENPSPSLLTRPAPINPDIPSDPKPRERIIPIPTTTDNNHQLKYKRGSEQKTIDGQHPTLLGPLNLQNYEQRASTYPTLPLAVAATATERSRAKRDSSDRTEKSLPNTSTGGTGSIHDHTRSSLKNSEETSHEHNSERNNHQNKRENVKQSSSVVTDKASGITSPKKTASGENHEITNNRKPYVPPSQLSKAAQKRDIPVPVTESENEKTSTSSPNLSTSSTAPKSSGVQHKRETNDKNNNDEQHKTTSQSTTQQPSHPAVLSQPVPVVQLLKNKSLE